ncbi:MAG: glycoside hydrolase family 130 protein [Bacteroidota bacterium]
METIVELRRSNVLLKPDKARVVLRSFTPGNEKRIRGILDRIIALGEEQTQVALAAAIEEFGQRHRDVSDAFNRRYEDLKNYIPRNYRPTKTRQLLIGSYFTCEYSLEAAALFNPSIIPHFDQSGVARGSLRFIMSLRATGEGHISSIEFRTGTIDERGKVEIDPHQPFVSLPRLLKHGPSKSSYEFEFDKSIPLSERAVFPVTPAESNGIEDARFVRLLDNDGSLIYYATYTAYNGRAIKPLLLETRDFARFRVSSLAGEASKNKGMALFPRKIKGKYVVIARQDAESLYLATSDNVCRWNHPRKLLKPEYPWESTQIGNCGSPMETSKGWLLLTHGVGPVRKYCIGAVLLDLDDPMKVIGRLRIPLLAPNESEREGYVPNVVYTCGALIHNGILIMPYAMSDSATSVATVPIDELLGSMV